MKTLPKPDQLNSLKSFLSVRYLFIIALFTGYFLIPFTLDTLHLSPRAAFFLLAGVIGFALFNLLSYILIDYLPQKLTTLHTYLQISLDLIFWISIGLFSGWPKSPYLYFVLISIMYSAILLKKQGVIFSVFLATLLLYLQGTIIKLGFIPHSLITISADISWYDFYSRLSLYFLIFSITGILAFKIVQRFNRATKDINRQQKLIFELKNNAFSIFSSLNTGFVVTDSMQNILLASPYAEKIKESPIIIASLLTKEATQWHEIEIQNHFYHGVIMPWIDNQNIALFSDITELKRKEENLNRKAKLTAIGNLTATIAHEIKNPLASLIGASELLFSLYAQEDPQAKELVDIITREGERVRKLLDDLFNYTEERKYHFKQSNIQTLLNDIATLCMQNNQNLTVTLKGSDSTVECDADRIKESFWNIILNSAEAMNNSGTIAINISETDSECTILLQDEGGGIPKEHITRIFDPFFSTKKRGTGIGLAVVYRTIREHHGKISVENNDDGAAFTITLPLNRSNR
ncbi:hypothetical protein KAH37_03360 [bacterium]|nr:hypothetical protein [bacterium]